jgi:predicted O-methyltransferase YrrM
MSLNFQCDNSVIEQVLTKMKKHGIIAQDAKFNDSASGQFRKEVTYRDLDFLLRLARTNGVENVDSILEFLKTKELISREKTYDKEQFSRLRKEIKGKFEVPWTSITPVMERLLFMLSSVRQPKSLFAAGIFCGNTLIWNTAPVMLRGVSDRLIRMSGVDIDKQAIDLAKKNFNSLSFINTVELVCEDALLSAEKIDHELDYVYLDADCKERGKKIYLDILKILYSKIKKNGWVLAHDTTEWCFESDFKDYKSFVRDKTNFQESVSFDIDPFGLELSIK